MPNAGQLLPNNDRPPVRTSDYCMQSLIDIPLSLSLSLFGTNMRNWESLLWLHILPEGIFSTIKEEQQAKVCLLLRCTNTACSTLCVCVQWWIIQVTVDGVSVQNLPIKTKTSWSFLVSWYSNWPKSPPFARHPLPTQEGNMVEKIAFSTY